MFENEGGTYLRMEFEADLKKLSNAQLNLLEAVQAVFVIDSKYNRLSPREAIKVLNLLYKMHNFEFQRRIADGQDL